MLIDEGVSPDQITATTWGIVIEVAGLVVRPVECHHWSSGTLSDGRQVVGNPIAFIVETEPGVRIYHYGDTCVFDMRLIGELYRPTVGLLGCTAARGSSRTAIPGPGTFLTGEMDADEAARAAEMLGLELAVACHYLAPDDEVERFLELVPELRHDGQAAAWSRRRSGETLVIDGDRHWIEGGTAMRLVTYAAAARTGVGVRRDGAIVDTGYRGHARTDPRRQPRARAAPPRRPSRRRRSQAPAARSAPPGQDPLLRRQLREPRGGEPERGDARGAVLLLEAAERRDRAGRADRHSAPRDADRLRGRARDGDRDAGRTGVSEARALDHVFGWTILHDVSARDVQFKDVQITLGKNPDTFAPIGPEIVTSDELGDWSTLRVSTTLNGETMQDAATSEMLFSPAQADRVPHRR